MSIPRYANSTFTDISKYELGYLSSHIKTKGVSLSIIFATFTKTIKERDKTKLYNKKALLPCNALYKMHMSEEEY